VTRGRETGQRLQGSRDGGTRDGGGRDGGGGAMASRAASAIAVAPDVDRSQWPAAHVPHAAGQERRLSDMPPPEVRRARYRPSSRTPMARAEVSPDNDMLRQFWPWASRVLRQNGLIITLRPRPLLLSAAWRLRRPATFKLAGESVN